MTYQSRVKKLAFFGVIALGIALRLNQFFVRPALWLDEAMLSISIVKRSWRQLIFSPLEFSQSAPVLYLQIAKIATRVIGPTELGLRLPAIMFSTMSLLLFAVLARRIFPNSLSIVAVAFFAVAPALLWYSGEAKPYAGDVLVSVLLTLATVRLRDTQYSTRWMVLSTTATFMSVFLADAGVLIVAGIGIAMAFLAWRERDSRAFRKAAILAPFWIAFSGAAVWAVRRRTGGHTIDVLHTAWSHSFWPLPPHSLSDLSWPAHQTALMYEALVGVRFLYGVPVLLALVGAFALWRSEHRDIVAVLGGPFVISLVASAAGAYPFNPSRVSLYLVPLLIVALVAGIDWIARRSPGMHVVIVAALFLVLIAPQPFVIHWTSPPWLTEDVPSVLAHIQVNRQRGDAIFAYWGGVPSTYFYGPRYGIDPADVIGGQTHGADLQAYVNEVDAVRGRSRVWVIMSHYKQNERDAILARLGTFGKRTDEFIATSGSVPSSVYLYDLR